MNKSLTEMQDIQKQITALRLSLRSIPEEIRNQITRLMYPRLCPKCGTCVGGALRISEKRKTDRSNPRIEVEWTSTKTYPKKRKTGGRPTAGNPPRSKERD